MDNTPKVKLDKFIGHSGYTSRQKAFDLIEGKRISVNGKVATHSTKVDGTEEILVDGRSIYSENKFIYIAYNKPRGIECTTEKVENNIIDAVNHPKKLLPVGRLDKNSEGLILLTNDKAIINKITNSANNNEKEYIVTLNHPATEEFLKAVKKGGLEIGEKFTKPCKIVLEPQSQRVVRITLTQGLNRQIRRMCALFDYQVIKLQRVRVKNIHLSNLKLGEWRNLNEKEVIGLNN